MPLLVNCVFWGIFIAEVAFCAVLSLSGLRSKTVFDWSFINNTKEFKLLMACKRVVLDLWSSDLC